MSDLVAEALTAHPELITLMQLRGAWQWLPPARNDTGEVIELHGLRTWPDSEIVDALRLRDSSDAKALRMDPDGGVLWHREGGLNDVLQGLLELPAPTDRLAPRLVKRTASSLWTA